MILMRRVPDSVWCALIFEICTFFLLLHHLLVFFCVQQQEYSERASSYELYSGQLQSHVIQTKYWICRIMEPLILYHTIPPVLILHASCIGIPGPFSSSYRIWGFNQKSDQNFHLTLKIWLCTADYTGQRLSELHGVIAQSLQTLLRMTV